MINYKILAIQSLVPNAIVTILGDKVVWHDERTQPTQEEIVQKIAEIEYTEEVEAYKAVRAEAYPVMSEQLDKIFHEGIDAWKAEIQTIKDAHPKAVIDNDTLNSRKSQALFDHRLQEYTKAQTRLSQYIVADGREEETEEVVVRQEYNEETEELVDIMETRIITSTVDPVVATITSTVYSGDIDADPTEETIENPLITQDNAERADAQAIVDATPSAVVDAYNAL